MALDIDFGNGDGATSTPTNPENNQAAANEESTPLNGSKETPDITGADGNKNPDKAPANDGEQKPATETKENESAGDGIASTGELSEGTVVEFDGANYTADKDGNLVDKDGNIFKKAEEVKDWMASMEVDDDTKKDGKEFSNFDITSIREAVGVDVEDAEGNPVEFTNDAAGVKSYIESVIDLKSKEVREAAINRLYADKPYLKEVDDYYIANGGSLNGFGQLPDRSGIQLDKDNEQQLEYVIRAAANEFGNKSLDDNYIKYLKTTGNLYDVAKQQLDLLVEKDKETRETYAARAKELQDQERNDTLAYWKSVNEAVNSGVIGGYKIPESFVREVNGKKITLTRNDFYDYLSKPIKDEQGNQMSAYQRDLNKMSDKDYLDKELIGAFLQFTGGSYKDLVDMAIKEEQVRTLRLKAKDNRATKTVRVKPKSAGKANIDDILL